jgi:hypothetical protein
MHNAQLASLTFVLALATHIGYTRFTHHEAVDTINMADLNAGVFALMTYSLVMIIMLALTAKVRACMNIRTHFYS